MTKRHFLLIGILIGLAVWLAPRGNFDVLLTRIEPHIFSAAMIIGIVGAATFITGVGALIMAKRKDHSAKMANGDALRVIRMQQRRAVEPTAMIVPAATAQTAQTKGASPATDAVHERTGSSQSTAPALVASTPRPRLSVNEGVFFQPVVHVNDGEISGFSVFRQLCAENSSLSFVRHATHLPRTTQAKFEADGIQQATSEARRVLGQSNARREFWIDVPISEALLTDRMRLQSVMNLMSAHPILRRSIRLLVDGRVLFKARKAVLDAVKAVEREGISMALNLSETGRTQLQPGALTQFDALYVSKTDVQQAVMRAQADAAITNDKKRAAPEGSSLLGTLMEARRLEMPVIATNVVCEPDVVDMLAEDIEIMTGSLFGNPRAIKAELLSQSARSKTLHLNRTG